MGSLTYLCRRTASYVLQACPATFFLLKIAPKHRRIWTLSNAWFLSPPEPPALWHNSAYNWCIIISHCHVCIVMP